MTVHIEQRISDRNNKAASNTPGCHVCVISCIYVQQGDCAAYTRLVGREPQPTDGCLWVCKYKVVG